MAYFYLETSAFLKRYREERGSFYLNQLLDDRSSDFFYLNLTIVEVTKVFFRLYKYPQDLENDKKISYEKFQNLLSQFAHDLLEMKKIILTNEIIEESKNVLQKVYLKSAIDLLHLTTFLIVKSEIPDVKLISADKEIIKVAKEFVSESEIIYIEN